MKQKTLLLFIALVLAGCSGGSSSTYRATPKTLLEEQVFRADIRLGDTEESVLQRLGPPNDKEFNGNYTALRYCDTTTTHHSLFDFVFRYGELVTRAGDRKFQEVRGSCENFYRPINWDGAAERFSNSSAREEVFNIDRLRITQQSRENPDVCVSGAVHKLILEGTIGPDSSFAIERLLNRLTPCRGKAGETLVPVIVSLKSGGGLLNHGYAMGRTFRQTNALTVVENASGCASSCAVAYLGGSKRIIEESGSIMFHAPYYPSMNKYGKSEADCDVGSPMLDGLRAYYIEMVGEESGNRLFERTMSYCAVEDGWVVTGGSAAELFSIATEK